MVTGYEKRGIKLKYGWDIGGINVNCLMGDDRGVFKLSIDNVKNILKSRDF